MAKFLEPQLWIELTKVSLYTKENRQTAAWSLVDRIDKSSGTGQFGRNWKQREQRDMEGNTMSMDRFWDGEQTSQLRVPD